MSLVWYVAYGSNLARDRFRCYVAGGRPLGGTRTYDGCRDQREPSSMVSLELPGGLVFAGESGVWGGGMAFFDESAAGSVACRGYLLTPDQLADVAAQEMWRPPGGEFAHDLAGLLLDVGSVHTMGPGRYETVMRLGVHDGSPLFTVTHHDVGGLEPAAPSTPYLRCIAAGLRDSHGWDAEQIAGYLVQAPGVAGAWTHHQLAELSAPGASGRR